MVTIGIFAMRAKAQTSTYTLPNLLTLNNGKKVTNTHDWSYKRRPELLSMFKTEMYGQMPGKPADMRFKVFDQDRNALGGKATRKQVTVFFNGKPDGPQMDILLYIPNHLKHRAPVILGLNFDGNEAVIADTAIKLSQARFESHTKGVVNGHVTNASRGTNASQWPIDTILSRGYAIATIYRGEVAPDFNIGFTTGLFALYPELENRGDNFATVGAWAWGLSRALDYLETDPDIDAKKNVVFGFSRLGKAALWAGATDERFAVVISNESGAGGAKLFHETAGEGVKRLCTSFPHWFCGNFRKYIGQDSIMPFDQHQMVALIAPRPVYIASAEGDKNSNPYGEFMTAKYTDAVYRLYHLVGMPAPQTFPALNTPLVGYIGYHIRPGIHDVTLYDWMQYLSFADKFLKKK